MQEKMILETIAKSLVKDPDQVEVNVVEGESSTILELKVAKEDVGRMIGRQGVIARSLRTILGSIAAKNGRKVLVEILD